MLGGIILMKTFFRFSILGLLLVAITAFSVSAVMAQDGEDDVETKKALYETFIKHYDKYTIADAEKAIAAAKEYITKFPDDKQYVDYFKPEITRLEKQIADIKQAEKDAADRAEKERLRKEQLARLNKFDAAYKAAAVAKTDIETKWTEAFSTGAEVINNDKDYSLDIKLLLAGAGLDYLSLAKPAITSQNDKILKYAQDAITDINSGKTSKDFGGFNYKYKTKENALGSMNYIIGSIKYYNQDRKDEAIKYFYKAVQFNSDAKKDWFVFSNIGQWYLDEAKKISEDRKKLDLQIEENVAKEKEMFAMERGYAERAMDAFARAYSIAKNNPKTEAKYKTALFNTLKGLFEFRYTDPKEADLKSEKNINSYVASIDKMTMPNPENEVKPITVTEEAPSEKPADATKDDTKSTGTTETKPAVKTTTKPATTTKTTAKPATTTKTTDMKSGVTRSRTVTKTNN